MCAVYFEFRAALQTRFKVNLTGGITKNAIWSSLFGRKSSNSAALLLATTNSPRLF